MDRARTHTQRAADGILADVFRSVVMEEDPDEWADRAGRERSRPPLPPGAYWKDGAVRIDKAPGGDY